MAVQPTGGDDRSGGGGGIGISAPLGAKAASYPAGRYRRQAPRMRREQNIRLRGGPAAVALADNLDGKRPGDAERGIVIALAVRCALRCRREAV
jgi:hypothetical protein